MNDMINKNADPEKAYQIPYLPDALPFNDDQKQWLGGFMAGLHSRLLVSDQTPNTTTVDSQTVQKPITIIFGSQTGNAESMAELAAEQSISQGLMPTVLDMDDTDIHQLAQSERLLVVTSTYGEGEMPDNAQALWDAINSDNAPSFTNTFYSVLALGDTGYDDFCIAGKMWDDRLSELGGQRINDRVNCDIDFEQPSQEWITKSLTEIAKKGSVSNIQTAESSPNTKATPKKAKSKYNKNNPLTAELITKKTITGRNSSKEICHFEFSLNDTSEEYETGDAVYIIPLNRDDLIDELLPLLKATGDEIITGKDKTLRSLLIEDLEIRTPSKEFIAEFIHRSNDTKLVQLLNNENSEPLLNFLWGKDIVDLLKSYPSATFTIEDFIALNKPLAGRAYSISSSIKKHKNQVHLTIGSVRYKTNDRDHNGVCSTYLADIAELGSKVKCYFSPNKHFSVPEDKNLPIIMVGPGTGIAPFKAFLEEREMTNASGDNWLFFGDRNINTDFIYENDILSWQKSGVLTRLDLAFSRDQKDKIYVQDRMIEQGAELYLWLEKGAYFYICGDAYKMAKDVDLALHQIIEKFGHKSKDEASEYVNVLKKQKRYVRDVY